MSRIYILALALLTAGLSQAQLTTVTIEPYQFHEAELGTTDIIPAGAVTYRIYANFTNESDYLSAVYGDASCALHITSTEAIFQASLGSHLGSEVNPAFFASNPELEFDSFATIGMATSEDSGSTIYALEDSAQPWIAPFEAGGDLIIEGTVGGLWFVFDNPEAVSATAGPDLKVLIAQITTTGEVAGQASFQVFENGDNTNVIEVTCVPLTTFTVAGCVDEDACNYDPLANLDDGLCEYAEEFYDCDGECLSDADEDGVCDELEVEGCTDPLACNYDATATNDDGSCEVISCVGCTDSSACNYDPNASIDDGSCSESLGCTNISACNYDSIAVCDDGSCEYLTCRGCTGAMACNYDPNASIDDGSCDYTTCAGCTILIATNYDSAATIDDGSCVFEACDITTDNQVVYDEAFAEGVASVICPEIDPCPLDLDNDSFIGTSDLLTFLGFFSTACP